MSKRNSKSGKSSPQRTISGGWQSAASLESSPSSCCTESQRRSTWKRRSIISISSHFPPVCRCLWLKILSLGPRQVHFEGLASYCKAETTFTFHFFILTLSSAFLSINNREMKSESGFSFAMASQPFEEKCLTVTKKAGQNWKIFGPTRQILHLTRAG